MDYLNDSVVQGVCKATRKTDDGAEIDLELYEAWYARTVKKERRDIVTVTIGANCLEAARRDVRVGRIIHVTGSTRQIRWEENGKKRSRLVIAADSIGKRDSGGSINEHKFRGVLGRNPEIRSTPGGQLVCDFSIAISEAVKLANGSQGERTDWLDFTAWGKVAEAFGNEAMKGDVLLVRGRMQCDEWTDKESGEVRSRLKFTADGVRVVGTGRGERVAKPRATEGPDYDDSDVPAGVGAGASSDDGEPPF